MGAIIKKNVVYSGSSVEIVDNLESTDSDKALSANMGRELKEDISGKVDVYQHNAYTKIARVGFVSDGRISISVEPAENMTADPYISMITFAPTYIRVNLSDGTNKQVNLT